MRQLREALGVALARGWSPRAGLGLRGRQPPPDLEDHGVDLDADLSLQASQVAASPAAAGGLGQLAQQLGDAVCTRARLVTDDDPARIACHLLGEQRQVDGLAHAALADHRLGEVRVTRPASQCGDVAVELGGPAGGHFGHHPEARRVWRGLQHLTTGWP